MSIIIAIFMIICHNKFIFDGVVMKNVKNGEKVLIFIGVLLVFSVELCIFTIMFVPSANATNWKLNNIEEPAIYLKPMTVDELITSYQNKLALNELGVINLDYLTVKNDTYYIGLFQDIILFVTPVAMKEVSEDIIYQTGIIIDQGSDNYDLALDYYKCLIAVNNEFIYDVDILIDEIIEESNQTIDKNNGLLLANITDEYEINFVVERKKEN